MNRGNQEVSLSLPHLFEEELSLITINVLMTKESKRLLKKEETCRTSPHEE